MTRSSFTIVGGGIAGLAAALALARIGRPSVVLERSPAFETAGAGLQLGPNAVRALKWIGAWEATAEAAFSPDAIIIRDGLTGRELQHIALGPAFERLFGQPYRVIHRGDLLGGLLNAARQSALIELRPGTSIGSAVGLADPLIGADGVHSLVRTSIGGAVRPRLSGQIIYRTLVPRGDAASSVQLWLCPGGHVVHYPVSGGRSLNLVAAVDRTWQSDDWNGIAERHETMEAFAPACDNLRSTLAQADEWRKWTAADLPDIGSWSKGSAALIGDAAHACLPYLAQGAAMALEDAVVLARAVDQTGAVERAYQAYERARRPRVRAVRLASARLGRIYHATGALRIARNTLLAWSSPQLFLRRLAWLYQYDPAEFIIRSAHSS